MNPNAQNMSSPSVPSFSENHEDVATSVLAPPEASIALNPSTVMLTAPAWTSYFMLVIEKQ